MDVLSSRVLIHPRDPEKTTAFYRDVLGLAIYRTFPGGTVFFTGQGYLEVVGRGEKGPSPDVELWFQVRDLAATLDELAERGVKPDREARREPWGLNEARISDPDGTSIVLVEVPPDHPLRTDIRTQ